MTRPGPLSWTASFRLSGENLDAHTLHLYLRDCAFVEYFNSFLLLPAFSRKVFYNEEKGYFEHVLGSGFPSNGEGGIGQGGGKTEWATQLPISSTTSMSMLYLTDDCIGDVLEKEQCWQWVLKHRLPLFMKSDLFSEFKLCKRLSTSSHHPRRMGADIHVYGVGGREESESREHIDPSSTNTSRPLLSTKSGMYSLWRFLQGTAGERSWLFWLDAERIKYCSSRQDQIILLRRLCERYLTPGVPLEIPTDTKFRLGVSWLWIGGVAGVQALQDTLAESLRHYWCHRFLLHVDSTGKSHLRPHTSPGLLQYTTQYSGSRINYPRVQTPLTPTKTPTFCRMSKQCDQRLLGSVTRKSSCPQSCLGLTSVNRTDSPSANGLVQGTNIDCLREMLGREGRSSAIAEERERLRGKIRDGERRKTRISKSARRETAASSQDSVNKSFLIFKRGTLTPLCTPEQEKSSSDASTVKYDYSVSQSGSASKLYPLSCGGSRLPQSLRQSYTSSPVWYEDNDERESPSRATDCPPSRSNDYYNLTKYTPCHLPRPDAQNTKAPSTSPGAAADSCHILSISGTPLLPSPPHVSPYSHMIHCLAIEHRKAGGHFEEYLKSLTDRVPLNCLLFWRDVQEYKALFVSPCFNAATVQTIAKSLYSQYVVEGSPSSLSLPPSLPFHLSSLLHPPFDDLFDDVEEHVLGALLTHWETMCREEDIAFQKVDRVTVSHTCSALRQKAPSTTSYSALDEISDEVDIETFNKATSSSHPHTARGTPLSSRLPSPFPHPSPLHHVTTGTHHIVTPSAPIAVGLNDIVNDPNEVNHFKQFLNEHKAVQHLMCWMEIEAFRGIPSNDCHLRDLRARQLRERYFTRRYLLGPHSPASREAQRQIVAAGGGSSTHHLPARPPTPVFREAQKHVRAKLEKKWLAEFLQTPEYKARSGEVAEGVEEGEGGVSGTIAATTRGPAVSLEQKFAHSHEALLLRKALQTETSRELFLSFLSIRSTSDSNSTADVEFWLEVQRFKGLCHTHTNRQVLTDKLTAMKECYLNSVVPPKLHIDIPQHMADALLKKDTGPYVFREAQATVFRHLYGYWQDYQVMSHDLSPTEIAPAIEKMKKQMKQLRKLAEEREREMQEREKMMMTFDFETAAERAERIKQEKERGQFGDATVNFTLVTPRPQYTYHTGESDSK